MITSFFSFCECVCGLKDFNGVNFGNTIQIMMLSTTNYKRIVGIKEGMVHKWSIISGYQ